jgi:hypothetical protein
LREWAQEIERMSIATVICPCPTTNKMFVVRGLARGGGGSKR